MIALDTNVVVRFLARDEPAQAARAKSLIEAGPVLVLRTVALEAEWVLRTSYGFDRVTIADGISRLFGLPGVEVEDMATMAQTLDWYRGGLDFADALHLASSGRAEAFATFDRELQRKARTLTGAVPVVVP